MFVSAPAFRAHVAAARAPHGGRRRRVNSRARVVTHPTAAAADRFTSGSPPPGRLDEQAAKNRVYKLASETPGGRGAMEAIMGCLSVMPGTTNHRLMLFRHPGLKSPLDTVALNLVEPRWVVAFDAIANAPKRPGDPPFCFGITHPALVPATTEPGTDVVPPKPGDVGLVCQIGDIYHDNKEERLYMTSKVVGRYKVDRVVGEHPFFVAETSRLVDEVPEDDTGKTALREEELRVWRLLTELESLSTKTKEGGENIVDYDTKRLSPIASERPPWDDLKLTERERPEMFSWAVLRRLGLDERQHLDAVRTKFTTARLATCADAIEEGVNYLRAVVAVQGVSDDTQE